MHGDTEPQEKGSTPRARSPLSGAPVPPRAGKKGRSGRPSSGWLDFTAALRGDPAVRRALRSCLRDPESRGYAAALKLVAQYDPELPGRKLQVDANVTVRGVIALPVMQVPQPGPEDRVLDATPVVAEVQSTRAPAAPHPDPRAQLLARLYSAR